MRATTLSYCYRLFRSFLVKKKKKEAASTGQAFDFESVILEGEKRLEKILKSPVKNMFNFSIPQHLSTMLYDLTFSSPLTFAAFQGDVNQLNMWLSLGIGGGSFKTILKDEREGNARPRIDSVMIEGEEHLINAYGLPGKGVEAFRDMLLSSDLWSYGRPLGISLGGESPAEYMEVFDALEPALYINTSRKYYYELNISCPNTDEGQSILKHPALLQTLLQDMRKKTDKVIVVKLSPDQSDEELTLFASIIASVEKTVINCGNTQFKAHDILSRGGGGLSGPALFKRTCEMLDLLSSYDLPIIATGGISSIADVKLCLSKGARLVGVATALAKDPFIIPLINKSL
jgi:dihydroorotate dehydrogenase